VPPGAFFQLVSPMCVLSASARFAMISAAVMPLMAQWSLFCTVAKNVRVRSASLS
jgi:hypothetical protein